MNIQNFIKNHSMLQWNSTTRREPVGTKILVGLTNLEVLLVERSSPNNSYDTQPVYVRVSTGEIIDNNVIAWSYS